jgi:hypothetical protein
MVNSIGDSGAGTLRWAIGKANADTDPAGALVRFDPAVFSTPQTITLGGQLELSNTTVPETIDATNVSTVTVSGNHSVRVFQIDSGVTGTLDGLTISGGVSDTGGGIYSAGSLTLENSFISGNRAIGFIDLSGLAVGGKAGGVYLAPASGSVTLEGNSFSNNVAAFGNLPPDAATTARGGAMAIDGGIVNLVHNTFTQNVAQGGTGADMVFSSLQPLDSVGGDRWYNDGTYLYHQTIFFARPEGPAWAGGIAEGGGLAVGGGSVSLVSNTFAGNAAVGGAGGQGGTIVSWLVVTDTYDLSTGAVVSHNESPTYESFPSGEVGWSSGNDISGNVALLQNNSLDTALDTLTPLVINQFTVDQGESQRSNIETVSVQFNQNTNLPSLISSGAITTAVQVVGAGGPLSLTADRYQYNPSTNTLMIDLTVGGGRHRTMLSDGRYQLQLDTAQITALGSSVNHLNLQSTTPSQDGQVRYGFFRLLGDLNGDGVVNSQDLVIERNQLIGYAGAVPTIAGDINGDGVVDINDYIALRQRLGKHL